MNKKGNLIVFFGIGLIFLSLVFYIATANYIKLIGAEELELEVGSTYNELGAKNIFNSKKGIEIKQNIDTKKLGTYEVEYCKKKKCLKRIVKVVDKTKPVITLMGEKEINISINGTYNELGATAKDNYDGDITDKIKIESKIDIKKAGKYEVTYTVTDTSNNTTTVTRTVNVNEKGPLSMSVKEFSLDGYFKGTILEEKAADKNYINDTVFYGDSITYNFAYYGALPWNTIWAKENVTPENAHTWKIPIRPHNVEMTLADAVKTYKPKRLIISLGANAVAIMTEKYFVSQFEELVKKVKKNSPDTLVIVQSIFPVDSFWDTNPNTANSINNTKINRLNYLLAEMSERQQVKFLNSATILKDNNGQCKKGYCYDSDGIHLTTQGHNKVVEYIKAHAYIKGE